MRNQKNASGAIRYVVGFVFALAVLAIGLPALIGLGMVVGIVLSVIKMGLKK